MDKYFTMEELHQILLEMLVCIDKFCRENNIRYSLGGGTLLGAIRHKGFIPWDDDVDIMMPRPDYDRFRKEFNGFDERYECIFCEKTKYADYMGGYAKVHDIRTILREEGNMRKNIFGINIDVFPIDGMPANVTLCRGTIFINQQFQHSIGLKRNSIFSLFSFGERIKKIISFLFPDKYVGNMIDCTLSLWNFQKSKYAGAICGRYYIKERYQRSLFEEYIEAEFENQRVMVIKQWDLYLSRHYGDYMCLPPEEKRINHCSKAYWR